MSEAQRIIPDWKTRYHTVIKKFGLSPGEIQLKRINPRFNFNPPEKVLLVHVGHTTGVLTNISAGGLAFHLNFPLKVGRRLEIKIDRKVQAEVEVVSNLLEDLERGGFRDIHRIRAKFLDDDDGYRCVVQTLGLFSLMRQS